MALFDPLKRHIDYLRVSVTDRCNLNCLYCRPKERVKLLPHREVLSYEELLRVVTVAARLGISRVRVTGGEPLLRRGIMPFLKAVRAVAGIEDVSVTTNGVLLSRMLEGLAEAGITRLNVSLDSLDRARYQQITGSDSWNAVWEGIERAEALGISPIKINVVPVRGINDDEIVAFARLTLRRRLHVRFIEFMPIGARDRWHTESCVPGTEVRERIEREFGPLLPYRSGTGAGPSDNHRIEGAAGVVGFINPITKHFCAGCRRLRLTADGKIRPCLLSDTEIDVKSPMRGGCDDGEIEHLLRLSLQVKPERHFINESPPDCYSRTMSKIGG